jgi:hypothetical protein
MAVRTVHNWEDRDWLNQLRRPTSQIHFLEFITFLPIIPWCVVSAERVNGMVSQRSTPTSLFSACRPCAVPNWIHVNFKCWDSAGDKQLANIHVHGIIIQYVLFCRALLMLNMMFMCSSKIWNCLVWSLSRGYGLIELISFFACVFDLSFSIYILPLSE